MTQDAPPDPCLAALRRIEALLQAGRAREALQAAQPLLEPGRMPAWLESDLYNLTGAAAHAVGAMDLAAQMWQRSAACAGALAGVQPWFNLAQLRTEQGRHADAQACLREVLQRAPGHAEAAARLGLLLAQQRRHDEAAAYYRQALAADPVHRTALANLALALAETGHVAEAEHAYAHALAVDPDNAMTHTNLGVLLAATRRPEAALRSHRRALDLDPRNASAHTNLGVALVALKRPEEALHHQRQAHELAPHDARIRTNLGNALARVGEELDAEQHLRDALAMDPAAASSHLNLGVLLCDQGRDAEAELRLRRALALRPDYALARLDLSCLLLAQGRFDEGWRLHEARYDPQLPDNGIAGPTIDAPMWTGQSLQGRSVLVWAEQGLGDQIQFCRFAAQLKARGATSVTLVCQGPLRALFETLPGVDRVVAADVVDNAFHVEPAVLATHDYWVFPLSLAGLLRIDLSSLPGAPIPYLSAGADRLATWSARHRADALAHAATVRVGLVWRGNPMHNNDAERSVPDLRTLAPLWTVPGIRFVSLQTGPAAHIDVTDGSQPMLELGTQLRDFADTAAALAGLDLLICVDTSIAHLAGALGRPCWVMLPHRKTDWRWLRDRDDSPWYPCGMRLFRQSGRGAWAELAHRVVTALRSEVALRGPSTGAAPSERTRAPRED